MAMRITMKIYVVRNERMTIKHDTRMMEGQ